ncbi:MAG: GFA family protein [Caulobacteraceae bacterium]
MDSSETESRLEGGCVCGKVRYRLSSPPMIVHCCHCTQCRRRVGTAFAVNALIEADRIELLSGSPACVTLPTESGRPLDDWGCPSCKTSLWSDYGRRRNLLFVRVGTLDDPAALPPDVHIFVRSKLSWVELPKGARAYKVYYDAKQVWTSGALERRAALQKA